MFFIFGTRKWNTDQGPVLPMNCSRCKQSSYWRLLKHSSSFTLFFIPVAPSHTYYLKCPSCGGVIQLNAQNVEKARQLQPHTQAFFDNQITKEQYENVLNNARMLS